MCYLIVSICGIDYYVLLDVVACRGLPTLMNWAGLRRLYNYHVTKHLRKVVRRHSDVLFVPPVERRDDSSTGCCLIPDMERTLSATSLMEIDTHLQR